MLRYNYLDIITGTNSNTGAFITINNKRVTTYSFAGVGGSTGPNSVGMSISTTAFNTTLKAFVNLTNKELILGFSLVNNIVYDKKKYFYGI